MGLIGKGRYVVRFATGGADLDATLTLRQQTFRAGSTGGETAVLDADHHDDLCRHVLVEDRATGELVCCFRLLRLASGAEIATSYAAQFYDLSALMDFAAPMVEIGRFCTDPARNDPDILRVAWAALTRIVDGEGVQMLFGCSSFRGTDPARHTEAMALLAQRHLAPAHRRPRVKSTNVWRFAEALAGRQPDAAAALMVMPPLLRTYLAMGGWVSDHAVIDHDLNTLHVFTGLDISAIPPNRARLLRALAG
jgi:L-ornithine Nalpha-acyltransferase